MKKRVLIVSPHFPPVNAPDHQRIRISLPYFEEFGWEPYILTIRPELIEGICDHALEQALPKKIKVFRAQAAPLKYTRKMGWGNLSLRALPFMYSLGTKIIADEKIDLVYFST